MTNFILDKDIDLLCVKAVSFPDGITTAHEKMALIANGDMTKSYFGVSYLYDEKILYMAGTDREDKNDPIPSGCETFTLKSGTYISILVSDFLTYPEKISSAFQTLLDDPRIDPNGCCAECYLPKGCNGNTASDVRCMVRLAD